MTFLSLFILCFYFNVYATEDEELKAKIKAKLQELKRTISQEQTMLRTLNDELTTKTKQLSEENEQLKKDLSEAKKSGEKIVYETKPDPQQQKHIKELENALSLLKGKLEAEKEQSEQKLKENNELIASLKKQLKVPSEQNKQLLKELAKTKEDYVKQNQELNLALKEAKEKHYNLVLEADELKQKLAAKPKEKTVYMPDPKQEEKIEELNQRIDDLNKMLQVKTHEIVKKDERINNLKGVVDNIDEWIKEVFW